MSSIYQCSKEELAALLEGEPSYRLDQLWHGLWSEALPIAEITTIPKSLRSALVEQFPASLRVVNEVASDHGATRKWVFALEDGETIETVLMHYEDRVTVCVSSQAGCAMGCTFCATGQAGFSGQLSVGDVIEQVMFAARAAAPARLSNVVFMGMGEPLANYATTVGVVRRLSEYRGLSARHLTVSTVGVAPAIERLAREGLAITLAVSLHAANDDARNELVPLNRRYPLERLHQACSTWIERTGRRISFEWALIDGVNDTDTALGELADYALSLGAHVNLIPLNPTPGYLVRGSSVQRVRAFRDGLNARGVNATVRNTRGRSIAAACGQLANVTKKQRRRVSLSLR
ncbi:MAG TPA: 23S rRNA (adenine(2503)-C(2))-methyltransferase RlmN [Acidimicrobiales bacterium]|nr:23S rRNA (adenine(2503)-C(2))-methyltransferase RlmN [Acidimicrobiales bacterium]